MAGKKDRDDYFHGDMDGGGVRITPPEPGSGWDEEESTSQVGGDKLKAFREEAEKPETD